ncbi:MAG: carbon monoxide dehydrogenase, partial [Candidatus Electrothrix sp. AUS4]|nr:carbon monoxide dehydrogenase [Candidatus Electrothrix sp. AUS4]
IPRVYFIGNLIQDEQDEQFLEQELGERPLVFFPDSSDIRNAERAEQAIVSLHESFDAPDHLVSRLLSEE